METVPAQTVRLALCSRSVRGWRRRRMVALLLLVLLLFVLHRLMLGVIRPR